jgi:hypothetical protein
MGGGCFSQMAVMEERRLARIGNADLWTLNPVVGQETQTTASLKLKVKSLKLKVKS